MKKRYNDKMNIVKKIILSSSLLFLFISFYANAQINEKINYQGKLLDNSRQNVPDGDYNFKFRLCSDSNCNTELWTEEYKQSNRINVSNGLFSVILGNINTLANVEFSQSLFLGVRVGGNNDVVSPTYDNEMIPRREIGASPFSFVSQKLDSNKSGNKIEVNSSLNAFKISQLGSGNPFLVEDENNDISPFVINSIGNVGIGIASPRTNLEVVGKFQAGSFLTREGAKGINAIALGTNTLASGNSSTAFGYYSTAQPYASVVAGRYNVISGTEDSWVATDPLFVLGNGIGDYARSNAFTVLKNGKVGIGVSEPTEALDISGNIKLGGGLRDSNGDIGARGQILSTTGIGIDWINGDGGVAGGMQANIIPRISGTLEAILIAGTTKTITVRGSNFIPTTAVSIGSPAFSGTINYVDVISPTELEINLTSGTVADTHDLILSNNGILNTLWTDNGGNLIRVINRLPWTSLSSTGTTFTTGNEAGRDIRFKSGMAVQRSASGMTFTGANPWASWVKFESMAWNRSQSSIVEYIFTGPLDSMMIGIGSTETNELSGSQYSQAEVLAYFRSDINFWGLYGNNGTIGTTTNQTAAAEIQSGSVLKLKFTDNGSADGGSVTLYQLPSADPADWNDESNVLITFPVSDRMTADAERLVPMIIPRDNTTHAQTFIAIRVQ